MSNHLDILIWILFILVISFLFVSLSLFFSLSSFWGDKISPYECGFEPFNDARQTYEIKYIIIGIIFMVLDLEICYLFPWSITWIILSPNGNLILFLFLLILTFGVALDWKLGGFEWQD